MVSPTFPFPFPPSLPFPFLLTFQTNQWEGRSDPVRGKFPGFPLLVVKQTLRCLINQIFLFTGTKSDDEDDDNDDDDNDVFYIVKSEHSVCMCVFDSVVSRFVVEPLYESERRHAESHNHSGLSVCLSAMVKVRGVRGGGSAPLLPFEPPAIV